MEMWRDRRRETVADERATRTPRRVRRNFVGACGNYVVARQVTRSIDFLAGWRVCQKL